MSLIPFYVICGLVCLFWLLVHSILAARLDSFKVLVLLLVSVFFVAAGDIFLGFTTGSKTVYHLVGLLSAPNVIPLTCLYLGHISRPFQQKPLHYIWMVIPAALFTGGLIVTLLKGPEQTDILLEKIQSSHLPGQYISLEGVDYIFYLWTFVGFRIVMALEAADMIVYCIVMMIRHHFKPANWFGFLFKGRKIRVLEVQMTLALIILAGFSVKVFIYRPFFPSHPAFTISVVSVVSTLLFFFGLFGLFGSRKYITLKDLPGALRYNYSRENCSMVTEEMVMEMVEQLNVESITKVISKMAIHAETSSGSVTSRVSESPALTSALFKKTNSWDEGSLVSRFQRLMTEGQLFLQPGLSLDDVSEKLNSNKTYISKMVNQTYGIGFPEVLNILRVDYAQRYMQKRPDALQDDVARASGFLSASSFNTVFKRITGYTPKVWSSRK